MKRQIAVGIALLVLVVSFLWVWSMAGYENEGYKPLVIMLGAVGTIAGINIGERVLLKKNRKISYDLFLSAPIYSVPKSEYESVRRLAMQARDAFVDFVSLRKDKIYLPGKETGTALQPLLCADEGLEILRESKYMVLIYPGKLVTGCLVEVGFAVALDIPCAVFVRDKYDLPNILRDIGQLGHRNIVVYSYDTEDDIIEFIRTKKRLLFKTSRKATDTTYEIEQ